MKDHLKQFSFDFVNKEAFKISKKCDQMLSKFFLKNSIEHYQSKSQCKDLKYFQLKYIKL